MKSTKEQRLEAIVNIVSTNSVGGQEQLQRLLENEGFRVTQATLSRDINELKIFKVPNGEGGYRYTRQSPAVTHSHSAAAPSGLVSVEISGQMGVIRTRPGYASVMAAAIDERRLSCIMGTIAGDDTVLLVIRKPSSPRVVLDELAQVLPDMDGKVI